MSSDCLFICVCPSVCLSVTLCCMVIVDQMNNESCTVMLLSRHFLFTFGVKCIVLPTKHRDQLKSRPSSKADCWLRIFQWSVALHDTVWSPISATVELFVYFHCYSFSTYRYMQCSDGRVAACLAAFSWMLSSCWNKFCSGRHCISRDWTKPSYKLPKLAPSDV